MVSPAFSGSDHLRKILVCVPDRDLAHGMTLMYYVATYALQGGIWSYTAANLGRRTSLPWHQRRVRQVMVTALAAAIAHPQAEAVEVEVDHGRRVKREQLAQDQSAHDGDAERTAQLAAVAETDGERQGAEHRRAGGHHDGAEAQQARFVDRLLRGEAPGALGVEREIDHHDGILLDQADEQDHADQPHDAELGIAEDQRQHGADAGGGQG